MKYKIVTLTGRDMYTVMQSKEYIEQSFGYHMKVSFPSTSETQDPTFVFVLEKDIVKNDARPFKDIVIKNKLRLQERAKELETQAGIPEDKFKRELEAQRDKEYSLVLHEAIEELLSSLDAETAADFMSNLEGKLLKISGTNV